MFGRALGCVFVLLAAYAEGNEHYKISIYQLPPSVKERTREAKTRQKRKEKEKRGNVRSAWEILDLEHRARGFQPWEALEQWGSGSRLAGILK